jgi:alanine racemase
LGEAIALRPVLADAEIFVLSGPFPGTEPEFLDHAATPVLNSLEQVDGWAAFARRTGRRLPAAVHVDTGMARLGLTHRQAALLAGDASRLAAVDPILIVSHLACADQPDHPLNGRQLAAFNAAKALFPQSAGSLSASSGIFLGDDWHSDWVRPGAALYGVQPTAQGTNPMAPVVRLDARIIQVREAEAGETVGYGATHQVSKPARLAVAAAGYADGYFRSLGNRGCGTLAGKTVPVVGRVSMDLVTFDVTGIDPREARPGAMIELIGTANTLDDVARCAGTIGYEILTALGRRYHRTYSGPRR